MRQPHELRWLDELQIDPSAQPDNSAFSKPRQQTPVSNLPERQREVLLLHVNDGLTMVPIRPPTRRVSRPLVAEHDKQ